MATKKTKKAKRGKTLRKVKKLEATKPLVHRKPSPTEPPGL